MQKIEILLERKIEGDTNCKDDVKELKKDYVVVREEVVGSMDLWKKKRWSISKGVR